ncbi:DNA methyltransferase [Arthrobacter sp. USHLN218]|uniref:DNA methyltransferase n=1 Tax=Arthrobacter sp. USHLN218 TaxID=3081232 RepID=UPI0030170E9A
MTSKFMSYVDKADFKNLFIEELGWDQPTAKPLTVEMDDSSFHVTPVAGFHGLHVWACGSLPDRSTQAQIDREVSATSTERLIIFHDEAKQEWRWPRYNKNRGTNMSKLLVHEHTIGNDHSALERRLEKIALGIDDDISLVRLLEKMRTAFDVEESEESSKAAKVMAKLYYELEAHLPQEGSEAAGNLHKISVTMTRILFLVFADDTMMWDEENLFQNFIAFETEKDGSDLAAKLELLFSVLNTDRKNRSELSGHLARFKYVNGGIFSEDIKLPNLSAKMRDLLIEASRFDWGNISPAIFGSMFQAVKSKELRRELGAHYTSEKDILKTLNPLILDELHQEFERTKKLKDPTRPLKALRERLGQIKILDPACGCGNFLIVAYRELRELELQIMESLKEHEGDDDGSRTLDATLELKVSLDQIYGIEIDEWPARIAETALHLMDRQCNLRLIEKFGHAPERLPISEAAKIHTSTVAEPNGGNALALDWTTVFPPGPENFIVGNPPFIGMSWMTTAQQLENRDVFAALPEAKGHRTGRLDYVACWYAKAFSYIKQTTASCAFVSTNSIIQGDQARVMDPIMRAMDIGIKFGHRTFKWKSEATGAAAVHCTIIGFSKASSLGLRRVFDYQNIDGPPH